MGFACFICNNLSMTVYRNGLQYLCVADNNTQNRKQLRNSTRASFFLLVRKPLGLKTLGVTRTH